MPRNAWQGFVAERVPALQALGWQNQIDGTFGPRLVGSVGQCDMRVADAPGGKFSLDLGIEIEGTRHPLLPILLRLRERGGIAAARIVDGEVITSLDDGRILKLPAERITRLLAVMDDLIEAACRITGDALELDSGEAPVVLDLEDLVTTRWQDGAAIAAHVARFRSVADIPDVPVPAELHGELAPVSAAGRQLAAASAGRRPRRVARRRHGVGQDRPDHRAYRHRGSGGPAGPAGAGRGADQPGAELDCRTRPVRAASARGRAARSGSPRAAATNSTACTS